MLEILFFKSYFRSNLSLCFKGGCHLCPAQSLWCKITLNSAIKGKHNCSSTKSSWAGYQQLLPKCSRVANTAKNSAALSGSPLLSLGTWLNSGVSPGSPKASGKMLISWSGNVVLAVRSCCSDLNNWECMVCLEGNFLADLIPSKGISRFWRWFRVCINFPPSFGECCLGVLHVGEANALLLRLCSHGRISVYAQIELHPFLGSLLFPLPLLGIQQINVL